MPKIWLGDSELYYEESGSGPPLLLLHGGLGTAMLHFWREIEFFSHSYHVIAPDLRGYGRSSPPRVFGPDFYFRDADDIAHLIEQLGLAPVHLAGWSDGGIAGLIVAVRHPELLRSLAVWGAQARLTPEEREHWNSLIDTTTWSEGAKRRFIEAQGPRNWPEILQRMLKGYHAFYNAGQGEIVSRHLGEIALPVLILHGALDPVVPVLHAYEMKASIPNAKLRIFESAGHALHRESEVELREELLRFLAGST
ncbi:MAG: alpha/beta fold hydrolase [Dehalococcoidia bacterium]